MLAKLGQHGFGLYRGIVQDAWLVAHLSDAAELGDQLEAAIIANLPADAPAHDLVVGIAGVGILAIERDSATLAGFVLDRLPDVDADTSMAHGLAGSVGVLARFVRDDLHADRAATLLDALVPRLVPSHPERLTWCHGDLGIALALHAAGAVRDRDDWRGDALARARRLAALADPTIDGAGLCHGAFGAAHLLGRLARATGDAEVAAGARRWLDAALALPPPTETDFLDGATGIALALHAEISDVEPAWNRLLLADI